MHAQLLRDLRQEEHSSSRVICQPVQHSKTLSQNKRIKTELKGYTFINDNNVKYFNDYFKKILIWGILVWIPLKALKMQIM